VTIRVGIADDHPIVLTGLETLLNASDEFKIVSTCPDGETVVEDVLKKKPDVLLLDIRMPGRDGFAVLRELTARGSQTRVVLLTGSLTEDEAIDALRLGARGILLKQAAPLLLLDCVRRVHAGEQFVEKASIGHAIEKMMRREEAAQRLSTKLTKRELELMRSIAQNLTNREIGKRLLISPGTVKIHLNSIYRKLGIDSRVELTRFARESGLA
jgi:DNA-binding NarL/FixJ family response regulator